MKYSLTCLLIDDDPEEVEMFGMALQNFPEVRLEHFLESRAALQDLTVQKLTPDIVFIDMNMPHMRGDELISQLRLLPHFRSIPLFLYSTSSALVDSEDALAAGATGVVTKPDTLGFLVGMLQGIFNSITNAGTE